MRKTEILKITAEGRDKGKQFVLTEMPALRAERWAIKALLALARSGVDLPEDSQNVGMAGLAHAGLKALHNLSFDEARPLLDEMWSCVRIVPDPRNPEIIRGLVMNESDGDDIEEIATIWQIRERVFRMHADFFTKGRQSKKS